MCVTFFSFFPPLPSFLRISYIVFTCVWMRYRSRLHYASPPRLDTRRKGGIEVAFFIARKGGNEIIYLSIFDRDVSTFCKLK